MAVQKKDWGQIEWMDNGSESLFQTGMNVGVVTLDVGAHQHRHRHYEEQVIYVIQGQALSIIDGEETSLTTGKFFHWKSGIVHEIYNIGNIPFQHFMISDPSQGEIEDLQKHFVERRVPKDKIENLLYFAVQGIRAQFLDNLHYAYEIYDWTGNLLLQSDTVPTFCRKACGKCADVNCPCVMNQNKEKYREETIFFCPYGLEIFHVPIFYDTYFLGYIQGGYIYQSNRTQQIVENMYDTPDSAAIGIQNLLKKIAKSIKNFCEFEELRQTMLEKDLEIRNSKEAQFQLLKNLQNVEYEMTDLKINNHFLFNTLNGMASMALESGQIALYQSIVDLSKMFHYTLRTQSTMVPLKKEVEYVKAYLQLQRLRYGEALQVVYEMDETLSEKSVPFNFLQPVVENAFVHGFLPDKEKKIRIKIIREGQGLRMEIENRGKVLPKQEVLRINQEMKKGSSHGMSMIYQKLAAIYKQAFQFELQRNGSSGMKFLIIIPMEI